MRVIIVVILAVFLFTLTAYPQLTDDDLAKIRLIVETENSKIKAKITALELQLTQQIQESENRLRSELNQQLNAKISDFTLVFGIISGGFFLLFAAVLLINALRNRPIIDNKTNAALILATISGILYLTSTTIAYEDGNKNFGHITCEGLTILDKDFDPRIELTAEPFPNISLYGFVRDKLVDIEAGLFGGHITLKSSRHKATDPQERTRIRLSTNPGMTTINMGESTEQSKAKGITLGTVYGLQSISVTNRRGEHSIYPED